VYGILFVGLNKFTPLPLTASVDSIPVYMRNFHGFLPGSLNEKSNESNSLETDITQTSIAGNLAPVIFSFEKRQFR
jgi:hypothetical protein